MSEAQIPGATIGRIRVLELRQRLEHATASIFDDACDPDETGQRDIISRRLAYVLAASCSPGQSVELYALVRLARHVYVKSSDVMHGRVEMVNVPQIAIDEWAVIVGQLEDLCVKKESQGQFVDSGDGSPSGVSC